MREEIYKKALLDLEGRYDLRPEGKAELAAREADRFIAWIWELYRSGTL